MKANLKETIKRIRAKQEQTLTQPQLKCLFAFTNEKGKYFEDEKLLGLLKKDKLTKEEYEFCSNILEENKDKLKEYKETTARAFQKVKELGGISREEAFNALVEEEGYTEIKLRGDILGLLHDKKINEATELLVEHIESRERIYTTKDDQKSEVWIYREGIYIPHGKSEIEEIARKILGSAYSSYFCNRVIDKIRADTYISADDFFKVNYIDLLPVKNGLLNIKTRELSDFTPDKIFFCKLPVEYNPSCKCEKINQFWKDVLANEDDFEVMYEWLGYNLLKMNMFDKAIMMNGDGENGKTKALEIVRRLLGIENCSHLPLKHIHEESFDICDLFGMLANISGDLSSTELKETGYFKQLTSNDTITVKRKFLPSLKFINYAKFSFSCNELPKVYDKSFGFWRRWILFDFPYKFVSQKEYNEAEDKTYLKIKDPDIISKIATEEEISGLLNASLDGLDRLRKNKQFSLSRGTQETKEAWIRKSDSFTAFCWDYVEEDQNSYITKKKMREVYSKYCKHYKLKGCSDKAMKAVLQEEFGADEGRIILNDERINIWEGVKINKNGQGDQGISNLRQKNLISLGVKNPSLPSHITKTDPSDQADQGFQNRIEKITESIKLEKVTESIQPIIKPVVKKVCSVCGSSNIIDYSDLTFCNDCKTRVFKAVVE